MFVLNNNPHAIFTYFIDRYAKFLCLNYKLQVRTVEMLVPGPKPLLQRNFRKLEFNESFDTPLCLYTVHGIKREAVTKIIFETEICLNLHLNIPLIVVAITQSNQVIFYFQIAKTIDFG